MSYYEDRNAYSVAQLQLQHEDEENASARSRVSWPQKLFDAANNPCSIIAWNEDGTSVIVDQERYEREVLNRFPGLAQIESFHNLRRQFRQYGFSWALTEEGLAEFRHPLFLQGHPELVKGVITRRRITKPEEGPRPRRPIKRVKTEGGQGQGRGRKKKPGPKKANQATANGNNNVEGPALAPQAGPVTAPPPGFRCPYAHLHVPPYPPYPGMMRQWSPPTPGSPPDGATGKVTPGSPPGGSPPPRWVMAPYGYPSLYPPWMQFQQGPVAPPPPPYGFMGYPEAKPVEPPLEGPPPGPQGRRVSPVPVGVPTPKAMAPPPASAPRAFSFPTPVTRAADPTAQREQLYYHDGAVKSEVLPPPSMARVIRLPAKSISGVLSPPQGPAAYPVPEPPSSSSSPSRRLPAHIIRIPVSTVTSITPCHALSAADDGGGYDPSALPTHTADQY